MNRLLEAGQAVIARHGLNAASVEMIAEAAGYSRGAFYSNFRDKNELFLELLRRDHWKWLVLLEQLGGNVQGGSQLQAVMRQVCCQLLREDPSCINWTEARMAAVRDSRFRSALECLIAEKRAHVAALVRLIYQRHGVASPLPADDLARGFMSLAEGLQLFRLSSPAHMTRSAAEALLSLFVAALISEAGGR